MLEKYIEKKLVAEVKKMGGIAAKFVSPGLDGMPDRLVLLPYGKMAFVELKAPGKKPRLLQIRRIKQLQKLGFTCYVIDDVEQIGGILGEINNSL
ncbi:VRR-NUC domain-containing protein [Ornithinibacillus sp. 4-3]|uniref:VRR-NUC domain-containing protein n=1 Tax=Ornithinibacillus sp. 4-3 TaxID=3231488 RepID=A0AB39HLW4_9BACI